MIDPVTRCQCYSAQFHEVTSINTNSAMGTQENAGTSVHNLTSLRRLTMLNNSLVQSQDISGRRFGGHIYSSGPVKSKHVQTTSWNHGSSN